MTATAALAAPALDAVETPVVSALHSSPASLPSVDAAAPAARSRLGSNLQLMGHSVATHTTQLLNTAMGMIGIPYRRGGTSASTGFDCSGFVRAIYAEGVGHLLPRAAHEQAKATTKIEKRELKPGDLVFFNTMRRTFSHVGIYVGEGKFIHSPSKGKTVRVESMESSYWAKRFNGARRVDVVAQSGHTGLHLPPDIELQR